MRSVRALLICTALCCIIAVSMIIGINIAWNNSPLSSAPEQSANSLVTNNLEVSVERINLDGTLSAVEKDTLLFGEDTVWTPGHAEIVYLVLTNKEETVVNYSIGVSFADGATAKNAAGEEVKLSNVLHFGIVDSLNDFYGEPADAIADLGVSKALSSGFSRVGAVDTEGIEILALLVYLPESAGELTGGEIDLGLSLYVTSPLVEEEIAPVIPNYFTGSVNAPAVDEGGATTESVTIGADSQISAVLPEGVKLENGVTELSLSVNGVAESEANVTLEKGESKLALDVHIEGIAADNTVPMEIKLAGVLRKGLSNSNLALYHVEDGETIEMTQIALADAFTAHNQFKYDPTTGDLTLYMASFSEVAVVSAPWDGTSTEAMGGTGTESDPYTIASAAQLAYFRDQVDAGKTYENEFVKLTANIDLNNKNFDPIGWGYNNASYNRDGETGKTFNGTFDGGIYDENGDLTGCYMIYNLYQNGWDLESATGTDYTYTNCGGGLFAATYGATIKNLTISNADIVMECVEMGIIVGLAQGSGTFENITIRNSKIANYQRPAGGIVGEISPAYENGSAVAGTFNFTKVAVCSDVVVGSLWGDFDAPVGGVIGARWDDADVTKVKMTDCDIACRLDVYSDVTSSYQWYAYRRAGMLIGNTDTPPADGKNSKVATADFLTCDNVNVCYGDWVHYTYCEFSKTNSSWPWVRVQAGENCSAYSNPRWGVAKFDDGTPVTSADHADAHVEGEGHLVEITFNQLYGGGQGVYGRATHDGVNFYDYKVTYMYEGKVLGVEYVRDNSVAYAIDSEKTYQNQATPEGETFNTWVTAASVSFTENKIPVGNTDDIVLYPSYENKYTARFVDEDGNVIYEETFASSDTKLSKIPNDPVSKNSILTFDHWEVRNADGTYTNLNDYTLPDADITIYPYYNVSADAGTGTIGLTPHDTNNDGRADYYTIEAASGLSGDVVIPGDINGAPVTVITDLSDDMVNWNVSSVEIKDGVKEIGSNAFAMTAGLSKVIIPLSVEKIGSNAFSSGWGALSAKQVEIHYEGTWKQWQAICNTTDSTDTNWDSGLGNGSKVICGDGTVHQLKCDWLDGNHTWDDWIEQSTPTT